MTAYRRRAAAALAVAALLIGGTSTAASAQVGGLRNRLKERVVGTTNGAAGTATAAPEPAGGAAGGPRFGGDLVELTAPLLDRFAGALSIEDSARSEVARLADPARQPAYEQCRLGVAGGPDGQKLLDEYTKAMTAAGSDMAAMTRASQAMSDGLTALTEGRCGPDPHAYAGEVGAERIRRAESNAAEATGVSLRAYAIVKERVVPFCRANAEPGPDGTVRFPGIGRVSWVYSAAEAEALAPRCAALLPALAAVA